MGGRGCSESGESRSGVESPGTSVARRSTTVICLVTMRKAKMQLSRRVQLWLEWIMGVCDTCNLMTYGYFGDCDVTWISAMMKSSYSYLYWLKTIIPVPFFYTTRGMIYFPI